MPAFISTGSLGVWRDSCNKKESRDFLRVVNAHFDRGDAEQISRIGALVELTHHIYIGDSAMLWGCWRGFRRACQHRLAGMVRLGKRIAPTFVKNTPYRLAEDGNLEMLRVWFEGEAQITDGVVVMLMVIAAVRIPGGLDRDIVEYVRGLATANAFETGIRDAVSVAVRKGMSADDLEWLRGLDPALVTAPSVPPETEYDSIAAALSRGDIAAASWLGSALGEKASSGYNWGMAVRFDCPPAALDWLHEIRPIDPGTEAELVHEAHDCDSMGALEWLRIRGFDMEVRERIKSAIWECDLPRLAWFWAHWPGAVQERQRDIVAAAIENDDLPYLRWARRIGLKLPRVEQMLAAVGAPESRSDVRRWLLATPL